MCHPVHSVDYCSSRDIDIQRELWTALSCLFVVCLYGSAADRKEGGTIRTLDLNSSIWSVFRHETMLHEAVCDTAATVSFNTVSVGFFFCLLVCLRNDAV